MQTIKVAMVYSAGCIGTAARALQTNSSTAAVNETASHKSYPRNPASLCRTNGHCNYPGSRTATWRIIQNNGIIGCDGVSSPGSGNHCLAL